MTTTTELKLRSTEEAGGLVLELEGSLDAGTSPELGARLEEVAGGGDHRRVILDLAKLASIESAGVAVILEARDRLREREIELVLRSASPRIRKVFALTLAHAEEPPPERMRPPEDLLSRIGQAALSARARAVEALKQLGDITYAVVIEPFRGERIRIGSAIDQVVAIGADAVPIVSLISLLVGIIMAMQSADQLRQYGATIFVADLVGISMTRELGPLITAIIVAGRSGSAIAAELGTMVVTEEIDALRTMGLNPISYLVVPRCLALAIALPCLAILADAISIIGGMIIGVVGLDIPLRAYFRQTIEAVFLSDLLTGLVKATVFGIIIANVGVFQGMHVQGGAEGVGRATTRAVVMSILFIILADAFFTALFYYL